MSAVKQSYHVYIYVPSISRYDYDAICERRSVIFNHLLPPFRTSFRLIGSSWINMYQTNKAILSRSESKSWKLDLSRLEDKSMEVSWGTPLGSFASMGPLSLGPKKRLSHAHLSYLGHQGADVKFPRFNAKTWIFYLVYGYFVLFFYPMCKIIV